MAGKRQGIPQYILHKPTRQARVILDGKHVYLGKHGTDESREEYGRVIAEWLERKRNPAATTTSNRRKLVVADLTLLFWEHAKQHYRCNGKPTTQVQKVRDSLRWLNSLYQSVPVEEFGPRALRAIQTAMIADDFARTFINETIGRIIRCFKWGVSQEIVPVQVYQALVTVPGLQAGRTEARETDPVKPVAEAAVNQTLPFMPVQVRDMVRLQLLTGCRPGEIVILRPCDVDRSSEIWEYRPEFHKTKHRGRDRVILLGPKAQQILSQWMNRPANAYCFSAAEAKVAWRAENAKQRKTKRTPSELRRVRAANPKRAPRDRYTTNTYNRAVVRSCEMAFGMPEDCRKIPKNLPATEKAKLKRLALDWRAKHCWSVNQLRHSRATDIRKRYGLEASQVILGHASADVTQLYAERDAALAARVMAEIGKIETRGMAWSSPRGRKVQ